jgi:transcriptional regulator with XRE-family HTH domain
MVRKAAETSVAERLREAREASGLSQGQAAQKMDMHRPTVTEIEAGRRKVSAQEVEKFAELYGVTVEWIVSGPTDENGADARLVIAARELSKMNEKDLDRLMKMLKMFRKANS